LARLQIRYHLDVSIQRRAAEISMESQDDIDATVQTDHGHAAAPKMRICPKCGMERQPTTRVCPADGTVLNGSDEPSNNPLSTLSERYEFLGETGRGGMAVIYKARDRKTGRMVAIKKLIAATLTETAFLRFQQEAKAITSLRHPNIIMVHEFGVAEDGEPYMVMDFIEGSNLGQLIKDKGHLTVEESMHRFIQLCDALQHAHAAGVLHRDLKPGNVMLSSADGSFADARLVDFGIAKLMTQEGEDAHKLTMTGQLFGSPPYMSPEQCRGFELDARTDIYSMGCVMFEALTGRVPIRGETILETIMMQVSETAPAMKEVRPDLEFPSILETIIAKTLAKDPADRYQSMRDLMVALMEAGIEMRSPGTIAHTVVTVQQPKSLLPTYVSVGIICFTIFASAIFGFVKQEALNKKTRELEQSELFRQQLLTLTPSEDLTDQMVAEILQSDLRQTEIDFQNAVKITDSSMYNVAKLKTLSKIDLTDCRQIGDEGLKPLATLSDLHKLMLDRTRVSDKGMETLLKVKHLNLLCVAQTLVTNKGLETIGRMPYITRLSIGFLPLVTGKGIEKLKDLHLQWLFMPGLKLDNSLESLAKIPSLERLDLHDSWLDDHQLSQLKNMTQLLYLDINGTDITSKGIQNISNLTNMSFLHMGINNIHDEAIDFIMGFQTLYELDLHATMITDRGVKKLAHLKTLRNLDISATQTGDEGVAAIATLPYLEKLDLEGTYISDAALEKLKACKTLKLLRISKCPKLTKKAVYDFDRTVNNLEAQESSLDETQSPTEVKRKLEIEFNLKSQGWGSD